MKSKLIGFTVVAVAALAVAFALSLRRSGPRGLSPTPPPYPQSDAVASLTEPGNLYGRVTTRSGGIYRGHLRWGGDEETFWDDYFNGVRANNPWIGLVPDGQLIESRPVTVFGFTIARRNSRVDLRRPFMTQFGNIAKLEARRREIVVTLRNGKEIILDRNAADDLADGLRVWDPDYGAVDLSEREIVEVAFLPNPETSPQTVNGSRERLHGTLTTAHSRLSGFIHWSRSKSLGSDKLTGKNSNGDEVSIRFDEIASIVRLPDEAGAEIARVNGEVLQLSGTRDTGQDNRGIFVFDPRYGRVFVSWNAFRAVSLDRPRTSTGAEIEHHFKGHDDFGAGRPLQGTITDTSGATFDGFLIYDLDESETIETLDAPYRGVNYTIPFELVSSIELQSTKPAQARAEPDGADHATVTLLTGEVLRLERAGDLSNTNTGMLVILRTSEESRYLPWRTVARIDFAQPP